MGVGGFLVAPDLGDRGDIDSWVSLTVAMITMGIVSNG
jgi:hypothetical protein